MEKVDRKIPGTLKNSFAHRSSVALNVKLQAWTRREGAVWMAWCPPLDVMTQAETEERAVESLREAVELWFESCIARNVLDDALVEAGFNRLQPGERVPPDADVVDASVAKVHGQPTWPACHATAGPRKRQLDAFTRERDIEVSIPAYIAAQDDRSRNRRASR
jgi:predicted RNase H-like HicB family nuclease